MAQNTPERPVQRRQQAPPAPDLPKWNGSGLKDRRVSQPSGVRFPHPGRTVRPYKHRRPPVPQAGSLLANPAAVAAGHPAANPPPHAGLPQKKAPPIGTAAAVRRSPGGLEGRPGVPARPRRVLPRPPPPMTCRAIARHPTVPAIAGTTPRRPSTRPCDSRAG